MPHANGEKANGVGTAQAKTRDDAVVVIETHSGITAIPQATPLTRLNFFDGKFLRADDLTVEQRYMRQLVALSNQGLGAGVVYGYDTGLAADDFLQIAPGLAIDRPGNLLYLPQAVKVSIPKLIDATRRRVQATAPERPTAGTEFFTDCVEVAEPAPNDEVLPTSNVYVIAICHAEALCGQEDVYGKLCEQACTTSTDRPYRLEGVVFRAIPLLWTTPFPTSSVVPIEGVEYLRSKLAHSYFGDDILRHPSAISRDGLLSRVWCGGAAYAATCCEVPLAVVARSGSTTLFLDSWIVRRERMDAPARSFWQWKMRMRPLSVFLAQVLQFQCQLADALSGVAVRRPDDPCDQARVVLGEHSDFIEALQKRGVEEPNVFEILKLTEAAVGSLRDRTTNVLHKLNLPTHVTERALIARGIVELPSAGYLPIAKDDGRGVQEQVRLLLGDGVNLRFCIVRPDYVAHAFEEAQHMDRISLVDGLEPGAVKPEVDILVPTLGSGAAAGGGVGDNIPAVADWVLFHRRRSEDCGVAPPAPRRYMVYQIPISAEQTLENIEKALESDGDSGLRRNIIGPVEFASGQFNVANPGGAANTWAQNAEQADGIRFGMLATVPVEDAALEEKRLKAFADDIPLDKSRFESRIVDRPPPWLPLNDTDGVIVLITDVAAVPVTCQSVYRLDPTRRQEISTILKLQKPAQALRSLLDDSPVAKPIATPLGIANFTGSNIEPLDDADKGEILVAWNDQGGGAIEAIHTFGSASESELARARAIGEVIGSAPVPESHKVDDPAAIPGDCGVVTLILPRVTRHTVMALKLKGTVAGTKEFKRILRDLDIGSQNVLDLHAASLLGDLSFVSAALLPGSTKLKPFKPAELHSLQALELRVTFVGSPVEDPALLRDQTTAIQEALELPGDVLAGTAPRHITVPSSQVEGQYVDLVLMLQKG